MNNEVSFVIVELTVRNHPGVMSHITGLFSRRGFNLEGIICGSIGDGTKSVMYLLVNDDDRLEQITKQLQKLHDVLNVELKHEYDHTIFDKMHDLIKGDI